VKLDKKLNRVPRTKLNTRSVNNVNIKIQLFHEVFVLFSRAVETLTRYF